MSLKLFGKNDSTFSRDRVIKALQLLEGRTKEMETLKAKLVSRCTSLKFQEERAEREADEFRSEIFSNERQELQKVLVLMATAEATLARVRIRLESIKDTGDVTSHVAATLEMLKSIEREVVEIGPSLSRISKELTDAFGEAMNSLQEPLHLEASKSDDIVDAAERLVEERILREEPPTSVMKAHGRDILEKTTRVAVLATGASYPLSPEYGKDRLEGRIMEYVASRDGKINVVEIASALDVPLREVEKTLFRLSISNKIRISRGE